MPTPLRSTRASKTLEAARRHTSAAADVGLFDFPEAHLEEWQPSTYSMTLQLASISLAESPRAGGTPLRLRVLLPPNFASAAARGRVAVKLEADVAGTRQPLGRLDPDTPRALTLPHLLAVALLESWNGGKLPSLAQLSPDQLLQLLQPLQGEDAVFPGNRPDAPYRWQGGTLPEVHPHLKGSGNTSAPPPASGPDTRPPAGRQPTRKTNPAPPATPPMVDGSLNFIAISPPDREHSGYTSLLELLKAWNFRLEPSNRKWWLRDRHRTLAFLAAHWSALEKDFGARFSPSFRDKTAALHRATLEVTTAPRADRDFDVEVSLRAPGVDTETLRLGMEKNQPYVDGKGVTVLLETSTLEALAKARAALRPEEGAAHGHGPRLQRRIGAAELAMADEALESLGTAFAAPESWKARADTLRHRRNLPAPPIPEHWQKILRPYQALGVAWLWHLRANDLGGILADEMGLGKTLQTLALVEAMRTTAAMPALVVCPAALVENWRREALRFAPGLRVFCHHGNQRLDTPEACAAHHLVITSYATLARDAELFQQVDFSCIAGDEAQHIKNRDTRNARALRRLSGSFRMLLTGTPIENSVDDLYSLFEFIMPGLLTRPGGRDTASDPRARAAPFILRRTKAEVAPELPEKIEQTVYCEMGTRQQAFYHDLEKRSQVELLDLQAGGAPETQVRFAAFRQLLRLRQTCADPRLLADTFAAADSAKASAFGELLEEALDAGRRLLVFSQFTSLLRIVGADMEARGVPFFYLDGNTQNRTALCQRFNDDTTIPAFLISLKAGGSGLNLAGADTVVHLDPWWNPAVEAQATARAHRIGQTRTVFSYRLIVSGTVEERVLALQQTKSRLLDELLESDANEGATLGLDTLKELLGV